jgi:spore germination protein KA
MLIDFSKPPHRDIGSPVTEQTIRGPQEAFVELEAIKIAQIRERLATSDLTVESLYIGQRFPVHCDLIYCQNLASPRVVGRVRERLRSLSLDSATNATRIGSLIRDNPWALFPTVRYSERADWVSLQLQSGKVAVSIEGDPFIITLPATLSDFYRTSEDYNAAWYDASFIRLIRLLAWAFGVMLPGWYIALTEVNPDLISPTLFNIIAGSHTGLPFTPFVEVVVMILVIEVLREAAVRLPKVLATTLGTVGAIVVGTAVVKAGFVSPQIIVLMTFTALSLFSVPTYELLATWRFMSWAVLVGAFVLGIYGIMLVTLAMSVELVSLTSFGTPYLTPLSPWRPKDWQNFTWRVPWRTLRRRLTESRAHDLRWTDDA